MMTNYECDRGQIRAITEYVTRTAMCFCEFRDGYNYEKLSRDGLLDGRVPVKPNDEG